MEAYNEQQLSMCETKDLVEYISELRVKIDDNYDHAFKKGYDEAAQEYKVDKEYLDEKENEIEKLKDQCNTLENILGESYSKHDVEELEQEKEELQAEIEKLKNPVIHNRDARCSQFDIKVGYSYIMDCLESVLTEEELDHFVESDYQEKADFVCEEVARAIDKAINNHIRNPVGQLEYHILDEVRDEVAVLRDSGHIYEEYPAEKDE